MGTRALTVVTLIAASACARADASAGDLWVEHDAIAQTVVDGLAAAEPDTATAGAMVEVAWVKGVDDVAAAGAAARDTLVADGLTVIDEESDASAWMVVVEDARGARAVASLDPHNGRIWVVAKPSKRKPPGACVAIPERTHEVTVRGAGIDQQGEYRTSSNNWALTTTRMMDVDGDAIPDAFVPRHKRHACPDAGMWDVYVVRGDCGHAVGRVGPGFLTLESPVAPLGKAGYRPITMERRDDTLGDGGVPEITTTTTTYVVKRKGKRARYARSTRTSTTGRCHHCAVTSCSSR